MAQVFHVWASFDPDTGRWWAESDDVPGLVSEAATLDALIDRVEAIVPELLALNGVAAVAAELEFHTTRQVAVA